MPELIKGSLKQIIVEGDVPINNKIHGSTRQKRKKTDAENSAEGQDADFVVVDLDDDDEEEEAPPAPTIDLHELEELREHYRREGEEQAQDIKRKAEIELARAKEDADKIRQQAENQRLEKLRALDADAAKATEKARKDGFEIGYNEGVQKGTDDGYTQGLKKCKDTLLDLKNLCDSVEKEKAALMAENRRGIFDIAMAVAEKITMSVFQQKDKQVLEKMIAEAAREFRSAKSVRVSLSKLDLSEDVEVDLKVLEKCFSDTVQVEFEVLEDAESGTLLMETDSEILDAGVSTQLRMIEELGRGKFRDKEPDPEETDDIGEAVRAEKPRKTKKAEKPVIAEEPKEAEVIEEPVEAEKAKEPKRTAETKKPKEPKATEATETLTQAVAEPVEAAAAAIEAAAEAADVSVEAAQAAQTAEKVTAEIVAGEQEATEEQ